MKAVTINGKRECGLIEVADPRIAADFAKIKIRVAPMCTEYNAYRDGWMPRGLGHEAVGEGVEAGRNGTGRVGQGVVAMPLFGCGRCELCVRGDYIYCEQNVNPLEVCHSETGTSTYAQYGIKEDWLLIPIPEGMSYDHAAMACCGLGPSFGAMQNLNVRADDTVLVVGLGPVGLGAVINGVYRNARVIGVEGNSYRANLARELGAEAVIDPSDEHAVSKIRDLTGGRGVDKAVECTGVPAAQKLAIDATRRRGHIGFVGWGGHIELGNMIPQRLTLQGCWHYNLRDVPQVMRMIQRVGPQIDKLITHRFPMSRVKEAWEVQLSGQCGKVLLDPWG